MTKRQWIRIGAFIGIFLVLFCAMMAVFSNDPDFRIAQSVRGFYAEPAESLQGVYIGSSNCYAFWNPLVAWREYGLTVYPYYTPALPFFATEYVIREVRKTQPNAMFIVNVNAAEEDRVTVNHIHHTLNYMKESEVKTELRDYLCDLAGLDWAERLELDFPWVRMRGQWMEYLKRRLFPRQEHLKAASHYYSYLDLCTDISKKYKWTDAREEMTDVLSECVDSLLDYCDEENVRVLFVSVPRRERTAYTLGRINAVCDAVRARGYDVLYLTDKVDEIGLDLSRDYYNRKHTNIHGSIKFTSYVSEYLRSAFGLEDLRGSDGYASWDDAWTRYEKIIAPYVLDFELDAAHRDYSLAAPDNVTVSAGGNGAAEIRWDAVDGADAYCVYRRAGEKVAWERLAETDTCALADGDRKHGVQYSYAVVPIRKSGAETWFGHCAAVEIPS